MIKVSFFCFKALFVICLLTVRGEAQIVDTFTNSSRRDMIFKVNYINGKILDNKTTPIPHGRSNFIECSFLWQTNGAKKWQQLYNYPQVGVSMLYGGFGNDSILGRTIALYPTWYIETNKEKQFGVSFRMGIGGAWFEKPFNRLQNPDNILVGSRITCIATFGVGLVFRPTTQYSVTLGGAFLHCSNGHTNIPNGGIDNASWMIALGFKPNVTKFYKREYPQSHSGLRLNARFGLGLHELSGSVYPTGGPLYKIYSGALSLSHRIGERGVVRLGLYAAYYTSFYDFIRMEDYFPGNERLNSCVFGPFIGHEYLIGRFSFITELYVNTFNPLYDELYIKGDDASKYRLKRWLSARVGFGYYVWHNPQQYTHQNVWMGLFIKTNAVQADFVDMTVGYIF